MKLHRDLVCGMQVDGAKTEFRADYAKINYYFCSKDCMEIFRRLARVLTKDSLESMSPIRFMEDD